MSHHHQFYINGAWVHPTVARSLDVINPATEQAYTQISMGSAADVDKAVAAARAAFPSYTQTDKATRLALLRRILALYNERAEEIAREARQAAQAAANGWPVTGAPASYTQEEAKLWQSRFELAMKAAK